MEVSINGARIIATFENVPLDVKGSVAYAIGMVLFIYGFTILNTHLGVILTVLGIVGLIIFGLIELKESYPVFDIRFFKNRKFLSSNFASLCAYLATFAVTTILNAGLGIRVVSILHSNLFNVSTASAIFVSPPNFISIKP